MYAVSTSQIEDFQREGAIFLPGLFSPWVQALQEAVEAAMRSPSPLERSYQPKDGSAPFFQDYLNWTRLPGLRDFVFQSDAGAVAAALMRSRTARFFHDHILVKRPGTSLVTPWHQDQPYYCVQGAQSVSFWTPLDPVPREISLQCVAGSHRWSEVGYKPTRFDGTPLYQDDHFATLPDIEAQREHLHILSYSLQPGDAVAFDFRTLHGAPGNTSAQMRRVVSTRWVGDDARWAARQGPTSPPFPHLSLPDGAALDLPDFPLVFTH